MTETNNLIKNVAFDIISLTTIWALINSNNSSSRYRMYFNNYNLDINYHPIYSTILGFGFSVHLLIKYI